ncbi:hypothetical protein [Streptomyces sp. LBL]|uniref:hypothetical protein n=1 Tax=Streptomyces sp. LBL TaxID=2940562 RepID=UPI0024750488|nr:hypothetical protein [Streptomyces sp. LBL]
MAFGVEELRVLRRALALALKPTPASAEDVQDCLRLAESLDEAMCEGARLRAFLVADLARYRAALPGTAAGYLALLEEALSAGHRPGPDDLAGLRALRGNPVAAALLDHCQALAEQDVRARQSRTAPRRASSSTPTLPVSRTRLLALPGGRSAATGDRPAGRRAEERDATTNVPDPYAPRQGHTGPADTPTLRPAASPAMRPALDSAKDPAKEPARKPPQKPAERPGRPGAPEPSSPAGPKPARPIPTPGEVFPRRKPAGPPSGSPPRQLAAG